MPTNTHVTASWSARRHEMETFVAEHPTYPYSEVVERLGLNKATDIQTIQSLSIELASIDLRHWQADEEEKQHIIEARDYLSKLSSFLYRRHWFRQEESND